MTRGQPRDERCLCGNLVARVGRDGVEILCRRCKRLHRIPWAAAEQDTGPPARDPAAPATNG